MNETAFLVIKVITELVPQNMIEGMAQVIFVMTCLSIVLIEVAVVTFLLNISNLINRILPESKFPKVSIESEKSYKFEWFRKLPFWKKAS
jgi:hypothetical protein